MIPFAQVRLTDERAVGCTAELDFRRRPDENSLSAVMIGWTWLSAAAQRSGINREAKLLLLAQRSMRATNGRAVRSGSSSGSPFKPSKQHHCGMIHLGVAEGTAGRADECKDAHPWGGKSR